MSEDSLLYPGRALRDWLRNKRGAFLSEEHLNLLATLADTLFFASLGKEEGGITRVRLVYHPRGIAGLEDIREHVLIGSARYDRRAWETIPFEYEPDVTTLSVKSLIKIAPIANLPRTITLLRPCEPMAEELETNRGSVPVPRSQRQEILLACRWHKGIRHDERNRRA